MHRLATLPGGWNPATEGVIFVEQQPAPIVVITAADTDIQTLAVASNRLPEGFPAIRVVNLLQLQQQLTIDTYAEDVLSQAEVIIVRVIGGRSYWNYGLEVIEELVGETGAKLVILPGDDRPDPNLFSHSTVALTEVDRIWQYFREGGVDNYSNLLKYVANLYLARHYEFNVPQSVPRIGIYGEQPPAKIDRGVGILFYRAHYLAGNTAVIDALSQALIHRNLTPVPIFVSSLREPDVQQELLRYGKRGIDVLLNTTSFSLASLDSETPQVELWEKLNVPVLQVICSGGTREQWENGFQGLAPKDMAMNVALPEVDGRIVTRAVSFKSVQDRDADLQTDVVVYEPVSDRINFVADLAANWVKLRRKPVSNRKIALILANYPTRDGRLANGVGLDTPNSCLEILKALQLAGYRVENIPETDKELIKLLTAGVTNDPESFIRQTRQSLSIAEYQVYFDGLPISVQSGIQNRWEKPKDLDLSRNIRSCRGATRCAPTYIDGNENYESESPGFSISGIELGHIFVGIQPARGYDRDPALNYHAPDLEPTHEYLAFYHWVRTKFEADAIVHVGKHGNLEWLPGKSVALSENCYPEAAFGALPHLYPFIVNDPGEGSQAKRRTQAVIIDHLTPPMTRAELYGNLNQLEGLIDEYYEAQTLDPVRSQLVSERILQLITQENLHQDLGMVENNDLANFLKTADGYLCELKEAQIRDGLHILGQCPQDRQLVDLIVAIARNPSRNRLGLTRAIAQDWQLDLDPLTADLSQPIEVEFRDCRILGDLVEVIEEFAAEIVTRRMEFAATQAKSACADYIQSVKADFDCIAPDFQSEGNIIGAKTAKELEWIGDRLLPALKQTDKELINLLKGLDGQYIPSGASGAPTRGRSDVLPTGRNFYSVDIRAIPTETAWDIGRKAAEALVERYTQDNGEYPQTLGLSVWGTSTMRTGGDDLAQALALLGVKPVWDGISRRVVDFEILPLSALGRPRVDVTLRISGFFRDAFPNLIYLFDSAVTAVASLDEPAEDNPLAARVKQEQTWWESQGLPEIQAQERSLYRIFGSKPSAYGAGLQGLIESQNWENEADLAQAYINWSAYAYTRKSEGKSAPEAFNWRLNQMQIVLQNQDNREHDILDSDDYYQFQGGLTAAVRSVSGKQPQTYLGDNSRPEQPKIRQLSEEILRVYRSRVINPKWIAGVMRHGYKGACEMAATLDFVFGYDATTNCVPDFIYQGIVEAYLFDESVQAFIKQNNPWALRDMAERLLEAHQRGLWGDAGDRTLNQLRHLFLEADGEIESQST
ncbi:cobaltochelatase subunit CobN [Merismopedia glauca]|uniref:Cobaltochelatase subunit CobN n=1 Tax=Merismopedia glauca CCAP 1448/3 TaxID=1296344 RepID=A0A2T1C623_9CYAN|nr:cobaltochelatase subunit CobN [Merismopedia glauca]PSB03709.1 cobaltochelatase subunit CobN [Merismopedia glauca CCAP 1448/3]